VEKKKIKVMLTENCLELQFLSISVSLAMKYAFNTIVTGIAFRNCAFGAELANCIIGETMP